MSVLGTEGCVFESYYSEAIMIYIHFILCFLLTLCGFFVVSSKNPIDSIVSLILCFCNAGIILFFFKTDFLGLTYIIVYVGAVAVLFLFVVMMVNEKVISNSIKQFQIIQEPFFGFASIDELVHFRIKAFYGIWNNPLKLFSIILITCIVNFVIFGKQITEFIQTVKGYCFNQIETITVMTPEPNLFQTNLYENIETDYLTSIDLLGQILFNYYFICFLLCGLVLLIALVGAIVLTIDLQNSSKKQISYRQLSRSDNFLIFFK